MLQIVRKRGGDVAVGKLHVGLPLRPIQAVDLHGRLSVVWRVHPGAVLVDPALHVQRAQEAGLGLLVVHGHIEFIVHVHGGAYQEQIGILILADAEVSPIIPVGIVQSIRCGTLRRRKLNVSRNVLFGRLCDAVRIDLRIIGLHRDRDKALGKIVGGFCLPILRTPFTLAVIGDDHIRLREIGISLVNSVVHHAGIAAAVAEGQHRTLADLARDVDRLGAVQIFLDKTTGQNELVAVFILEVHVGRLAFVPSLLYFKVSADHVFRLHIVSDWGIGYDGAGGGALGTADDPDLKTVIIEIFHKLHHRQVEIVYVAHVVETRGLFLPELYHIVVKLFHGHARVGFCKVPRKRLVGDISGFYRRGNRLQLIRDAFRVVIEAVFDEHHRVIVGIEGLTCERTVHIEYSDAVLGGNIIRSALFRDGADVVDQAFLRAGPFVPERKRFGAVSGR